MDSARRGGFSCRSIFHYNLYLLSYGLRTQKTDGTVTTDFYWANGNMTYQYDGTNELYFRYDESGAPVSVNINGTDYYYVKNLQGDIIALLDGQGTCVVKYTYDVWGKVLSVEDSTETNIGTINPLRYRGYYYDSDLGFYYLQSRYYDPTVGRFLNADDVVFLWFNETLISNNLFAYCDNNTINREDSTGNLSFKIKISTVAGIAYGIYKTQALRGMRMYSWRQWAVLGLTFAQGFIIGFCTVYSFFSFSKKAIKPIVFGVLNVIAEISLGNWRANVLLEAFIDGYGGTLTPSLLKSDRLSFLRDTIVYFSRLLNIKVY